MNRAKYKVVVTDYEFASFEREREILKKADAELFLAQCRSEEDFILQTHDADGLLNNHSVISRRVIESLTKCKIIVSYGIGVDTIDIQAATEHGIFVANVPAYCIDEVSDHTMALLFSCARKICFFNQKTKSGKWDFKLGKPLYRLRGKILGLVGFGKIARRVAFKAKAFGLNIVCYDPYVEKSVAKEEEVKFASFDELLSQSDFVSIHVPLNPETKHLLNEENFKLMKPSAILINTARGGIVDTPSLYKALREGWIAGAAIDVVEGKPLSPKNPLLKLDNLIITPHTAWYSEESIEELQTTAASEVARVLSGGEPISLVNPEVY